MEIRQTKGWANYMESIGWQTVKVGSNQAFLRKIPFFHFSFIKIQHPKNPLDFKKIDQLAKDSNSLMVVIEPTLKGYQESSFKKAGYTIGGQPMAHSSTIQIDLKPTLPKIFASFSENARRNIKKAEKNDLKIKIINYTDDKNGEYFETFLKLLKSLTDKKKFWVPSDNEMKKKISSLKDSVLFFAYQKDNPTPIATVWVGKTKDSSHYIQTGNTDTGYELLANYLLVWEIVKYSKKLGFKYFDFEGIFDPRFPHSNPKWINFSLFKKRFHNNLIENPAPKVKFANLFFELFYRLGQKLP